MPSDPAPASAPAPEVEAAADWSVASAVAEWRSQGGGAVKVVREYLGVSAFGVFSVPHSLASVDKCSAKPAALPG